MADDIQEQLRKAVEEQERAARELAAAMEAAARRGDES
jgi:hypothetical protein